MSTYRKLTQISWGLFKGNWPLWRAFMTFTLDVFKGRSWRHNKACSLKAVVLKAGFADPLGSWSNCCVFCEKQFEINYKTAAEYLFWKHCLWQDGWINQILEVVCIYLDQYTEQTFYITANKELMCHPLLFVRLSVSHCEIGPFSACVVFRLLRSWDASSVM